MNTLRFAHPWILALLWLAPLGALLLAGLRARRGGLSTGWVSPAMQARLLPPGSRWRFSVQLTLAALGFALALAALARPQFGEIQETVTRRGRDLVIALDVSRSMLARDVLPNRLARAQADLIDLVSSLEGDRVGLVLFRHKAVQTCPLTTDYGFLLQMLDQASPDSAPPGETDIGDALHKCLDALEGGESAHQAVVLVSDGEDLAEKVDEALEKAAARGITVFTVGFGSLGGAAVPEADGARLAYQGEDVTTRLNPEVLKKIASKTGGVYLPVGTARANLGDLYQRRLRHRAARDREETTVVRRVERFGWFLLPALLCWFAACALSQGRPLLRKALPLALFLFLGATPGPARAADPADTRSPQALARAAARAAQAGRYAEAADLNRQAAARDTARNAARHLYNAGCALYNAGRYDEAAEAFRASAARNGAGIPATYNEGCALLQMAEGDGAWRTNAAAAKARSEGLVTAARVFQQALEQEGSQSEKSTLNLASAAATAGEAREHARALSIQERFGQMDAGQLAGQLLDRQRRLALETAAAFSNDPPAQITRLEALAAEQRESIDLMGPLSAKLEQALQQQGGTNGPARIAELRQFTSALTDLLRESAGRLRDADPAARDMAPAQERAAYNLWKGVAGYDLILREDIRVQSNQMNAAGQFKAREPASAESQAFQREQEEASRLTRLFSERFAQTVPEGGQPAPPAPDGATASNAPGITAETRAKILELAGQAARMQDDAVKAGKESDWPAASILAKDSHAKLKEIEDLLPKQNQQQQQDQKQQDQKQQDQKQQDQKQKQDQQQQDPKQQDPQKQDQKPPEQPPKPDESKPQPRKDEMSEEQARALLEKAKQREKEYQAEKQKRAFFDRASGERDW